MNCLFFAFGSGRSPRRAQLSFVFLICCLAWPAAAIDRTWTGDSWNANWSEPDNWLPVGIPQTGDNLIFNNLGSQRYNNNDMVGLRVFSIVFRSSGYTLNGNPIQLDSDITTTHTSGINVVRLGIEFANGGGTFGTVSSGRLEVAGNVTLSQNQSLIAFTFGTNITISGAIVGDGDLIKLGTFALILNGSGANTYSGWTTIQGGSVYLAKSSGARAISARVSLGENAPYNCLLADLQSGQYPPEMSMSMGQQGTWALTNGATVTNLTMSYSKIVGEGLLNVYCDVHGYGSSSIQPSLYIGNQTRTFYTGDFNPVLTVYGHILGPSGANAPGIIKDGLGRLVLATQNTYSGPTLINVGEVEVRDPQGLGNANGDTRVKPWSKLTFGRISPTSTMVVSEPIIMEGGELNAFSDVMLNGPLTLATDSTITGPSSSRLDLSTTVTGPGGFVMHGGYVRLSGAAANTFGGDVVVQTYTAYSESVLELAKPNGVDAIPNAVTLIGYPAHTATLRQFQNNGARNVTLLDYSTWHLNGYYGAPNALTFRGAATVDAPSPGALQFAGLYVNTNMQILFRTNAVVSNYTARILGNFQSFASTNELFIPAGVTLDMGAAVQAPNILKRGPGKMILRSDNPLMMEMFVKDGEVSVTDDHALGIHTTVFDGATLWLDSIFNFGSLTLQGNGFQGQGALACQGIALFSSNIVLSGATTINTLSTNGNLHLQAAISGTGPLIKNGIGYLTFEGNSANTFSGDTVLNAGLTVLAKNNFIPSVPNDLIVGLNVPPFTPARAVYGGHDQVWNRIFINRDSIVDLNNWDEYSGDITLNAGLLQTLNGTLHLGAGVNVYVNVGLGGDQSYLLGNIDLTAGQHRFYIGSAPFPFPDISSDLVLSGNVRESGGAASILKDGPGEMLVYGSNSFSGTFTIADGTVIAQHSRAFGTSAGGTIVDGKATLYLDNNARVLEEPLILNSTNAVAFGALYGSNIWGGTIALQKTAGINVVGGILNLMSGFDCCAGIISGPGGITKSGAGSLYISGFGANTYTGVTTVNEGVLDAFRILKPAIPGDVVVSGSNTVLRTGRSPANSAMNAGVSMSLSNGAMWVMNATNIETLRSLTGNGWLQFSPASMLTIDNTNFSEFSGSFAGPGSLHKRGAGVFGISGKSPFYGGECTVFAGTLKVDGNMNGAPVTVKGGARLRGDGAVGNVVATESEGTIQVDASFKDHPASRGGDLEVVYLTMGPGAGISAEIFGPSPTAGNDLLIVHGPATLGGATLSAEFRYPPHEGDVITLLRKNSINLFNGTFAGWPEGVTRKLGDVTVRASYMGIDGNDFILTVTNLPLAYGAYRLAEGNGNQTVEPNECNLLYVSLTNKRNASVVITNVIIRALTPGVAATIASAVYPNIPAGAERENLTAFQFRTDSSLHCGQPVSFEIVFGVQGEGEFAATFEVIAGEGPDCNSPTGPCESCFVVQGSFSAETPRLVRYHNFIGGPSPCFPPKRCPEIATYSNSLALPYVTHTFTNTTTNEVCVTAQLRFNCSGAASNALGAVAYLGTNDYHDACVNYLGDTGVDGTQPFAFRVPAGSNFMVLVSARSTNVTGPAYTLELFGLPCPPPTLRIVQEPNTNAVSLQWSTAYADYRLQAAPALSGLPASAFQNVSNGLRITNGTYRALVPATNTQRLYRLAK